MLEEAARKSSSVGFASDRKSTRLNSSHANISYAVFCLKKKTVDCMTTSRTTRRNDDQLKFGLFFPYQTLSFVNSSRSTTSVLFSTIPPNVPPLVASFSD